MKWIKCQVDEENQTAFSDAQEGWGDLKKLDGFLGQVGGWDRKNSFEAAILSFWRDYESYQQFMNHDHDEIVERNGQKNTYNKIYVAFFEVILEISSTNMTKFLRNGKILRTAEYDAALNKQAHFEHIQQEVWNKGMVESPGMLACVFCKKHNYKPVYLVASLWDNNHSHQEYADNKLPSLIKQAGAEDSEIIITENLIEMNPKWTVI